MADYAAEKIPAQNISAVVLKTKLYRPAVSADMESRADLVMRLESNRHRALTLISAPTGYGKSVLGSMWLDASDAPGCWVSLDEDENNPHLFLAYLVAAIQSVVPDSCLDSQALLETSAFPTAATVARILLDDLERLPAQILLVLDDLHVIRTPMIFDMLSELLRYPSPRLHLVLITRRDPLLPIASLRAYGQITEIRAQDLRFSSVQTAGLLSTVLRREVDQATAAVWTRRAEGWVMALRLAAIAMRQRNQYEAIADDVPLDGRYLQEHLLAEVMDHLDQTMRAWLGAIAWLDRFCAALCTAVLQPDSVAARSDLTGEDFIAWLRRENLFIIALDDEDQWFRLHHLFRNEIRKWGQTYYQEDQIARLHKRAGVWFAHEGFIDEAIHHLVLAADLPGAEELVLKHRHELMNSEQWQRLQRWLDSFPVSALEQSALLAGTAAIVALHSGDFRQMESARLTAKELLADLAPDSNMHKLVLSDYAITTGFLALGKNKGEELVTCARTALDLLPPNAHHSRALASGLAAAGLQMNGQFTRGYRSLSKALKSGQWTQPIQNSLMAYMCMVCYMQGNLRDVRTWAERVLRTSTRLRMPESLCHARYFLGVVYYLQGEYDAAEPYLAALVEDQAMLAPTYVAMGAFALALIQDERGDSDGADTVIDRMTTYFRQTGESSKLALIEAFAVELALRRGEIGVAQRKEVGVDFDGRPPLWFFYIPQLTPVKLLLARRTPEALATARAMLEEFEAQMRNIHRTMARIQSLVLLAVACDAQGDTSAADDHLRTALGIAQAEWLIRPFVELGEPMAQLLERFDDQRGDTSPTRQAFVVHLLTALMPDAARHQALTPSQGEATQIRTTLLEALTARELQVLQMLATDCTPAEIAAQNVVSISTVRSQIKNIYRKLDVNSRMEAVNCARELNIL